MSTRTDPLKCILCSLEHKTRPEVEFCDPERTAWRMTSAELRSHCVDPPHSKGHTPKLRSLN